MLPPTVSCLAVENGFITPEHLFEDLKIQVVEELEGTKRRLIGEALREKEYITTNQIDEMLELM